MSKTCFISVGDFFRVSDLFESTVPIIPMHRIIHIPTQTLLVMSQTGLSALAVPVHSLSAVHPGMKLE